MGLLSVYVIYSVIVRFDDTDDKFTGHALSFLLPGYCRDLQLREFKWTGMPCELSLRTAPCLGLCHIWIGHVLRDT